MKLKQMFCAVMMFFALGVLIAGINSYTTARFNQSDTGTINVNSAEWVIGDNFEGWTGQVNANRIAPGDSGVINLGRKLTTNLNTKVYFTIDIPETAQALEFYLVDNTGNAQRYRFNGGQPLQNGLQVELPTHYFKDTNDFELRWVYPEDAEEHVSGAITYSLTFEQVIIKKTLITDVWVQSEGTFNNVRVTVDTVNKTLSFRIPQIGEDGLIMTNVPYTPDVNGIDYWISVTPEHGGMRVVNPEGTLLLIEEETTD